MRDLNDLPVEIDLCRACQTNLKYSFIDLGLSPISNAFIKSKDMRSGEMYYPLHAFVCHECWLVQLGFSTQAETHFNSDYVYFSSFSSSWLQHAKQYVEYMKRSYHLSNDSKVMEIASNDGYLLQYFVESNIPCLGIEPTSNTAAAARAKGIETRELFFNKIVARNLAQEGWKVDLLLGNNVLAHVPDINDFVQGMSIVLKPNGIITLEFPHLLQLMINNQFDTLYHEHYFYLSVTAILPIFENAGLRIFKIEQLPTHGGSLRIFACLKDAIHPDEFSVSDVLQAETFYGISNIHTYINFSERVHKAKRSLLQFLISARSEGRKIVAYGAAAKGNTLLNFCGINSDLIEYVVDRNPQKQGRFLPGSRLPVKDPIEVFKTRPDYVFILPWNLKEEVMSQMAGIRDWAGKFIVPVPELEVIQ